MVAVNKALIALAQKDKTMTDPTPSVSQPAEVIKALGYLSIVPDGIVVLEFIGAMQRELADARAEADTRLLRAEQAERETEAMLARALAAEASLADARRDAERVSSYWLPDDVRVERVKQRGGPDMWAVRRHGGCMAASGTWDYEPLPSNRSDAWLAAHRFDTAKAAIDAAMGATHEG